MENKDIVNFSKFFEEKVNSKLSQFRKEDFGDFFLSEEKEEEIEYLVDTTEEIENREKSVEPEPVFDPPVLKYTCVPPGCAYLLYGGIEYVSPTIVRF